MAPKFQGVDFYDADGLLTEEERAVRDTVRAWVDDHVIPVIGEHYVAGRFPMHLVPQMAELGLFGANLPEEFGCAGLNNVAYGLIMQELERGDSGVRSFASVQGALVMYPIYEFGSDEQKRRWLPELASGRVIGCFGLTEPDYGSNPGGMITAAKETRDGWVLNGAKMWITNGSTAGVAIVWAKAGRLDDPGSIRGFIVPTDAKGFAAKDQQGKLTEITKAQLLCLQLGRLKDQGKMSPQQVSLAKRNNVSMATEVARESRRLLGANGILAEYQAMRHLANLESVYTYEGTHDIHTLILGQEITGLSAFN